MLTKRQPQKENSVVMNGRVLPRNNRQIRNTSKEEIIRNELHAITDIFIKVWRTGVALLPSLMIAISFFRKDIYERMLASGELQQHQSLPWDRYLVGTAFLLMMAAIFSGICCIIANRYQWYAELLSKQCNNHLPLPPSSPGKIGKKLFTGIFFIFPIFDFCIRVWFRFGIEPR